MGAWLSSQPGSTVLLSFREHMKRGHVLRALDSMTLGVVGAFIKDAVILKLRISDVLELACTSL